MLAGLGGRGWGSSVESMDEKTGQSGLQCSEVEHGPVPSVHIHGKLTETPLKKHARDLGTLSLRMNSCPRDKNTLYCFVVLFMSL